MRRFRWAGWSSRIPATAGNEVVALHETPRASTREACGWSDRRKAPGGIVAVTATAAAQDAYAVHDFLAELDAAEVPQQHLLHQAWAVPGPRTRAENHLRKRSCDTIRFELQRAVPSHVHISVQYIRLRVQSQGLAQRLHKRPDTHTWCGAKPVDPAAPVASERLVLQPGTLRLGREFPRCMK